MEQQFDLSALRDYTVEAGRPDTITPEKLEVYIGMAFVASVSTRKQWRIPCWKPSEETYRSRCAAGTRSCT